MLDSPSAPLVVAIGGDLFFTSRIEATARAAGAAFLLARTPGDLSSRSLARRPALVLIDLASVGERVGEAVAAARGVGAAEVVAFGPHRDLAARARALSAGCDRWLPNSRLAADLATAVRELLRP